MTMKHAHLQRMLLGIVLGLILAGSFFAYLQPAFVIDLANRLIMCF